MRHIPANVAMTLMKKGVSGFYGESLENTQPWYLLLKMVSFNGLFMGQKKDLDSFLYWQQTKWLNEILNELRFMPKTLWSA